MTNLHTFSFLYHLEMVEALYGHCLFNIKNLECLKLSLISKYNE